MGLDKKIKKPSKHAFELPDGHHLIEGGLNGFTKRGDKIILSQNRLTAFSAIAAERDGITELVDVVAKVAAQLYAALSKRERVWWIEVVKDLGLTGMPEENRLVLHDATMELSIDAEPDKK